MTPLRRILAMFCAKSVQLPNVIITQVEFLILEKRIEIQIAIVDSPMPMVGRLGDQWSWT